MGSQHNDWPKVTAHGGGEPPPLYKDEDTTAPPEYSKSAKMGNGQLNDIEMGSPVTGNNATATGNAPGPTQVLIRNDATCICCALAKVCGGIVDAIVETTKALLAVIYGIAKALLALIELTVALVTGRYSFVKLGRAIIGSAILVLVMFAVKFITEH